MKRFYLLILLAACSHDTKRNNLVDPALSTPPQLSAAVEDTTGTVHLSWTEFVGPGDLSHWLILINADRSTLVDSVRIEDAKTTSYAHESRTLGVNYVYRVAAVNVAGLEVSSDPLRIAPTTPPPVSMKRLELDSFGPSMRITWTEYVGPSFDSYHLWRSLGEDSRRIAELPTRTSLAFTDTTIDGGNTYAYWITASTTDGVIVVSDTLSGTLYPMVETWAIDLDPAQDFVRIYPSSSGGIEALITTREQVRLETYSSMGDLMDSQVLFAFDPVFELAEASGETGGFGRLSTPLSTLSSMLSTDSHGSRYLSVASDDFILVQRYENGEMVSHDSFPFRELDLTPALNASEIEQVHLWSGAGTVPRTQVFDNVFVQGDGAPFFEDFETVQQWGMPLLLEGGFSRHYAAGALMTGTLDTKEGGIVASNSSLDWSGARVEVDVVSDGTGNPGVSMGPSFLPDGATSTWTDASRAGAHFLRLVLADRADEIRLDSFTAGSSVDSIVVSWPVVPNIRYRLGLSLSPEEISIRSPYLWAGRRNRNDPWGGVIATDQEIGLFSGTARNNVSLEGTAVSAGGSGLTMSDLRRFEIDGEIFLIATIPAERAVAIRRHRQKIPGTTIETINWPTSNPGLGLVLGGVGNDAGDLAMPISATASGDGRYYVLDAGSSRVQVYDADGRFITNFGSRGSRDGQFELGDGRNSFNFGGSIAVDKEGFIYVADIVNQRIQKFAP